MNIYLVGGAVRDQLLGLPIRDRDFVVVGANPSYMLQQGFKAVGKDFPVFLHPETQEEYALARTERKVAQGYAGFSFYAEEGVTLIQDLARRDLTINAMAQDENGTLIDPFHGEADLRAGILRHVSTAFVEDPVRILRLARFAARYPSFSIAPETLILMREMVQSGEVDALVPERVWQELAKGLLEIKPSRMLQTLRDCGALARLLPELNALFGVPQPAQHHPEIDCGLHSLLCLDSAAQAGFSLSVRFAALVHDLGKGLTPFELLPRHHGHEASGKPLVSAVCDRLRVPATSREIALLTSEYHGDIHRAWTLRAQTICARLQLFDVVRRPARLLEILQACISDARGRTGFESCAYLPMLFWQKMAIAYTQIDAGQLAQNAPHPSRIAEIIYAARLVALKQARKMWCIEYGYPE